MQSKNVAALPEEAQKYLDGVASWLIEIEKKEYHNDLVPFAQRAAEIRAKVFENVSELRAQFRQAESILEEILTKQESQQQFPDDALFAHWQQVAKKIDQKTQITEPANRDIPLQELAGLSWSFMDRAYHVACQLLKEKRYEEAESIYFFLNILNSLVLEYFLGLAAAQQAQNKFKKALETYATSLSLQPESPLLFLQIANCYYQLQEFASCLKALEFCMEYAGNDPKHTELLLVAKDMHKLAIQNKK